MDKRRIIKIADDKLWRDMRINAIGTGTTISKWVEEAIREKLAKADKEINEFLTKDLRDPVKF